jgi:hypothetical protein
MYTCAAKIRPSSETRRQPSQVRFNSLVSSNISSSSSMFGGGMPATGQHATPMVLRVTLSAISCASCGFVTHVLYLMGRTEYQE